MPIASYVSQPNINRKDWVPDPKAVEEMVDPLTKTVTYIRVVLDPNTNQYVKVLESVKTAEEIAIENKMKKQITYTVEERKNMAVQSAVNLGVQANGVQPKDDVNLQCRCGFKGKDELEMFRHKTECTFVLDQKKESELAKIEAKKAAQKDTTTPGPDKSDIVIDDVVNFTSDDQPKVETAADEIVTKVRKKTKKRKVMSVEARKRMSDNMKARWAAKKEAANK